MAWVGIKRRTMEIYKGWEINEFNYAVGYYEAHNLNDCDAPMKWGKNIDIIKQEIDDEE